MKFKSFVLTEAAGASEEKLTHLEHAEDHHINAGAEGFQHAFDTLHNTHELLAGRKSKASVSLKLDGSPSIVFGTHPENGKFFVASKSAFNATPKLNYTHEDIERNHGHAPGLVSKLKAALNHLPKVAPKEGVYQGDFMYNKDDGDVRSEGGKHHFTPNTITYSIPHNHEEDKKVDKAKIGVAVHTAYKGPTLQSMKAEYNADTSNFNNHSDVHLISPRVDHKSLNYSKKDQDEFQKHMAAAIEAHGQHKNYEHLGGHQEHLKTYINSTVREGTKPSLEGYQAHLTKHYQKKADGVRSDAAKQRHTEAGNELIAHSNKKSKLFNATMAVHQHLQNAKNVLNRVLSSKTTYGHHVGGNKVKPEGFVSVINNRPTKIVDRDEFSRLNFQARPR
jgi:hypothetical protein